MSLDTVEGLASALVQQHGLNREDAMRSARATLIRDDRDVRTDGKRGLDTVMEGGIRDVIQPRRGRMNKLESRRAAELEVLKRAGEIRDWSFEPMRLLIADDGKRRAYYTPDFLVWERDGSITFEETKGHWRTAGRLRIKVAVERYPMFHFRAIQPRKKKEGGGWKVETFG